MRRVGPLLVACSIGLTSLLMAPSASAQPTERWVQIGLEWARLVEIEPEPVVDAARIKAQIEKGCSETSVRFGNTALFRGQTAVQSWSSATRNAVSLASIVDDFAAAELHLEDAFSDSRLDPVQHAALENQHILIAMQFQEFERATALLAQYGLRVEGQDALTSDRLFWSIMALSDTSREAWRNTHLPRLDEAHELDPTSFQVLVWRVIAWLKTEEWREGGACAALKKDMSSRLLDLSDAGACPLMMGHMSFAVDRALGSDASFRVDKDTAAWRDFAVGVLGIVTGDRALVAELERALQGAGRDVDCGQSLASELGVLRARLLPNE